MKIKNIEIGIFNCLLYNDKIRECETFKYRLKQQIKKGAGSLRKCFNIEGSLINVCELNVLI